MRAKCRVQLLSFPIRYESPWDVHKRPHMQPIWSRATLQYRQRFFRLLSIPLFFPLFRVVLLVFRSTFYSYFWVLSVQTLSMTCHEVGWFFPIGPLVSVYSFFQYKGNRTLAILSRLRGYYHVRGTIRHSNIRPYGPASRRLRVWIFLLRVRIVWNNGLRFSTNK